MTIHELVQSKLAEAGIEVTSWPVLIATGVSDGEGLSGPSISNVKVTVGDFTVVGKVFLSGELAEIIKQHLAALKKTEHSSFQIWPNHCVVGPLEEVD